MLIPSQEFKGLRRPVQVWRDAWGIPHIKAQNAEDAFFALGHTHATDRLWQMDAMRRRALGRYAEWVGEVALPSDMLARRMGLAECSRRDAAALNAKSTAMLDAYTRGVNACINSLTEGDLPKEYVLLKERPEPWEAWHSIAVLRQASLLLNSIYPKLWRALALPIVGESVLDVLRMDGGANELVCIPPGATTARPSPDLNALTDAMAALLESAPHDATGGGSNNWALHGSRTHGGHPMLAGDPHRLLEIPNLYVQCHLACDEFDVVGLTTPGVPGFPHFGHNANVAWSVTVAFVDTADLFVERFDEDGGRYLHEAVEDGSAAHWQSTRTHEEHIVVRGREEPVRCEIVRTARGAVVAGDVKSGHALVLSHAPDVETDYSFNCMRPMLEARNVRELYAACKGWGLIDHNLVAADTDGHIGHYVRAKVPKRPAENGWLPVPGWLSRHHWNGWIDWENMPHQIDPEAGVIVTANNRVNADQGDYLCTDAHPPNRAQRIWDRLAGLRAASVSDMGAIHTDALSLPATELREKLSRLSETGLSVEGIVLRNRLLAWDCRMKAESMEAAAYVALRSWLTRAVAEKSGLLNIDARTARAIPPGVSPLYHLAWCLPNLLRTNDARLLNGTDWEQLLAQGLNAVATEPVSSWGDRHRLTLRHPLGAAFPNQAELAPQDKGGVDGDNDTVFTTGYAIQLGTNPTYASLARYVFVVGDWDACRWVVFHGASGDMQSSHFDDQTELWRQGEMFPMLYDWSQIAAQAESQHVLRPSSGA